MARDGKAIDASARHGWTIYNGRGHCMTCHAVNPTSPMFTDNLFHNIGVSAHKSDFVQLARKSLTLLQEGSTKQIDELALQTDMSELGRFLVTKRNADIGAFKTPGLRNILLTHPYFRDGSQDTLWDTIDHYNKGGVQNPFLDGGIQRLGLTEPEMDDLVAFVASLTSDQYGCGEEGIRPAKGAVADHAPATRHCCGDGARRQGAGAERVRSATSRRIRPRRIRR